ncbi:hypothetical protein TFLX_01624 [Thermoflexales bacterium]|nr:hypothetical protein TFLX_01624 [Thermoflexales bacterium]
MKRITLLLLLIVLVLAVNQAWAMSSTHYKLDWFTPLTSSGGGPATSAHYAANFTIGQTVIGASASTNYKVGLGYWYGALGGSRVYLPLILK